ncbi:Coiled-coil domain-containing protein [Ooceraea biroi]|nr:Coiled-coil domain-containing protein [Ooceraea biroi]
MSSSETCEITRRIGLPVKSSTRSHVIRRIDSAFNNDASHRRRHFPRTQRYWTSGHENVGEERNVRGEQSPFVFPSCSQTLAYLQWWKARKKKAISERSKRTKDQHNYKTLQSRDILQRLRVDVKIEAKEAKKHKDPDEAIAMTDVDPEYFTELCGRSVKEKFSLEEYIRDTREILRTRLLIGQEKDYCIRIDQQFEQESHRLEKIQYRTRRYVDSFEEFLSKDHEKSMSMLEEAEREAKLTEEIRARRNELSKRFGQSRLDVYFWEENWRMAKMCQMFLYRISPVAWRAKHDWLYQPEVEKSVMSVETTDLFGRYKTPGEDATLEDLIELFEKDVADAGPAELYFEDPLDLIRIFRAMESQNLSALIHLESFAEPMADMAMTITMTEAQIKREIGEITSTIDDLENSIAKTEVRAADLEEHANYLLRGVFRHFVCSEEVLYLRVFVEDTYETCVGPNDANLDSFSMTKWIERIYEELNLQLDNLPREIVRTCEKEGFRQEMKAIKEAEDAARKFELMLRLLDELKRIMEPPPRKKRPLIQRSAPAALRAKPPSLPPQPTDEEAQYLTFFTDYCKRDDFVAYRSKFPDDFDLTFQSKRRGDAEVEATTSNEAPSNREQEQEEDNKATIIENVTESVDLFENSSCVYVRKDRISLTRYASSVT